MRFALALAMAVLVASAIAGTVIALWGHTTAGWFVWVAGGMATVVIAASTPWLINFFGTDR